MKRFLLFPVLLLTAVFLHAEEGGQALGTPYIYKRVGGTELKLYITRPEATRTDKPGSALVFFHGGGWMSGHPRVFNSQAEYLAARGVTCVLVEYRLLKGMDTPESCIQDAKSAMRWVRSHAADMGIDPERIVAAGNSAGGHLAACTGIIEGFNDPADDLSVSAKPHAIILYSSVIDNGPDGYGYKRIKDRYPEFSPLQYPRVFPEYCSF